MNRLLLLAFGAVLGFGLAAAASHFAYGAIGSGTASQLGRFGLAFERVRDNYVDKQEDNTLIGGAIDGMLTNLDAHSSYFDPKTFDAMETKAAGAYGGVGLVITVIDGIAKVVQPIDNTPASRAGVKKDDILVAIDGTPMRGHALDDVSNRMRGTIGTEVTLTVQRGNARMDFKLTRQAIEVERLTYRREGDVGYVKIVAFSDRTDPDLRMAVAVLKKQIGPSLKGFVIDLRNNGGGVLQ
ncbi:MAG: PDZ domain-containing protein, partial [Alphaproteobacteria bacterium]|nr:PDZ domain-containing protein [Alphaproteobacteria bacterium]